MHLELVKKLLGRRTLFHPVFADITHSVTASLMLSQALYWTRTWLSKPEQSHADGWFWKSQAEWQDETGLSRKEQETARRVLRTILFLDEKKQGMPSRIYFRLDLGRIATSIHFAHSADGLDWNDDYVVFQLLGRPISFHRSLSDFTHSTTASLMLSHAIGLTARILPKRPDGWFWKSIQEWKDETGLSRWEQESARRTLRDTGLLLERRAQIHMYFKVDLSRLQFLLSQPKAIQAAPSPKNGTAMRKSGNLGDNTVSDCFNSNEVNGHPCLLESSNLANKGVEAHAAEKSECGKRANSNVAIGHTELPEKQNRNVEAHKGAKAECGKRANSNVINGHSRLPVCNIAVCTKTSLLYKEAVITTGITKPLQPHAPPSAEIEPAESCGGGLDLVFPRQLSPALHDPFRKKLLAECPHDAQAILDVMAHAYQTKGVQNPAGWLNTLITRAKNQTFDPLPGLPIAAAREEQLRLQSARLENEIREKQAMALKATQAPPVPAENLDGRYKSREAAAFFASFRAGKEKNSAPAVPIVTNSLSNARQASPLTQQKPLAVKKKGALLISSARKLGAQ